MINKLHICPEEILSNYKNPELCIIFCTTPDEDCAKNIAQCLLTSKLAACVTLLPRALSIYYWKGIIKQQEEVQLVIKSKIKLQKEIFMRIKVNHPYQNPELLVLPIINGDYNYLSWLNSSVI